jgi:hypothetical protein
MPWIAGFRAALLRDLTLSTAPQNSKTELVLLIIFKFPVLCFQSLLGFVPQWKYFLPWALGVVGLGLLEIGTGLQGQKTGEGSGELAFEGDLVAQQNFRRTDKPRKANSARTDAGPKFGS